MEEIDTLTELLKTHTGIEVRGGVLTIVVLACNFLGKQLKGIPSVPNAYIPHALAAVSAILYPVLTDQFRPMDFVIGAAGGAIAIGLHQGLIHTKYILQDKPAAEDTKPPTIKPPLP